MRASRFVGAVTVSSGLLLLASACGEKRTPTDPPVERTLIVTVSGSGTVTSVPGGVNASGDGTTDTATFANNTDVALTATPATGWEFQSWGGACAGTVATCAVPMSTNRTVNALFRSLPQPVDTLVLFDQSTDTMVVGDVAVRTAVAQTSDGARIPGATIDWVSRSPSIVAASAGAADSLGVFAALAAGDAWVVASYASASDSTLVHVLPAPMADTSVVVSPDSLDLVEGFASVLTARHTIDGTPVHGLPVAWSSLDPAQATVASGVADSIGIVTAVSTGFARIVAQTGTGADTAVVNVLAAVDTTLTLAPSSDTVPVGGSASVAAVWTANGVPIQANGLTWTSLDSTVASVSPAPGDSVAIVTGLTPGSALIEGRSGAFADTALLVVESVGDTVVIVLPPQSQLAVGQQASLSATVLDETGTPLGTPITWSTLDAGVATVAVGAGDTIGTVTAVGTGTARIVANSLGHADTALVTVVTPVDTVVTVAPALDTVVVGGSLSLVASVTTDGVPILASPMTWTSLDPGVAAASAGSGDTIASVSGLTPGTARIEARLGALTDTADVVVVAATDTLLVIVPPQSSVVLGESDTLVSRLVDDSGNTISAPIGWSTLDTQIATVQPGAADTIGVVTPVGVGVARIVANALGRADTALVDVLPPPDTTLVLAPAADTLGVGEASVFAAAVTAGGFPVSNPTVQFQLSDPTVGALTPISGTQASVTATFPGTTVLLASLGSQVDSSWIEVVASADTTLIVEPSTDTIGGNETVLYTAVAVTAQGDTLANPSVSFTTLDGAVANAFTIPGFEGTGWVRGVAGGETTVVAQLGGAVGSAQVVVHDSLSVHVEVMPPLDTLTAIGDTTRLEARLVRANGDTVSGATFGWQVSNFSVARYVGVSPTSALVRAEGPGSAPMIATHNGPLGFLGAGSDSSWIHVELNIPALDSIVVDAPDTLIGPRETVRFTATAFTGSDTVPDVPIAFATSDFAVARAFTTSFEPGNGYVMGWGDGSATITASFGAVSRDVSVTVADSLAVAIDVAPRADTLRSRSDTVWFDVRMVRANGDTVPDQTFFWRSLDQSVATVRYGGGGGSNRAFVLPVDEGQTRVIGGHVGPMRGTLSAGEDTVTVDVILSPITDVSFDSASYTVEAGDSTLVSVVVTDSVGGIVADTAVAWQNLTDPVGAPVRADGLQRAWVVGVTPGDYDVEASVDGVTDTTTVTVLPRRPVDTLVLNADTVWAVGEQGIATAIPLDSTGTRLFGRVVSWTSIDDPNALSFEPGLVNGFPDPDWQFVRIEGFLPGTFRVEALVEGLADTVTVRVRQSLPIDSVRISAFNGSFFPSPYGPDTLGIVVQTDSATATLNQWDTDGFFVIRPNTWTSSDPSLIVRCDTCRTTRVLGTQTGFYDLIGTAEGVSDTLTLAVVDPRPVVDVRVDPYAWAMLPGDTIRMRATLLDALGNFVDRPVNWSVIGGPGLDIDATGLVTASSAGWYQVVGESEGPADTVSVSVEASPLTFTSISGGTDPTCATASDGGVRCWSRLIPDSLNRFEYWDRPTPLATTPGVLLDDIEGTCGIDQLDVPYCWEFDFFNTQPAGAPELLPGGLAVTRVVGWGTEACALTTANEVHCWPDRSSAPVREGGSLSFDRFYVGRAMSHRCAITTSDDAYCWGFNNAGQLGDGTTTDAPASAPVLVTGGHKWQSLSVMTVATCGVTTSGEALCWGSNGQGELGVGTQDTVSVSVPTPVVGGHQFRAVMSSGQFNTCAVRLDGSLYCWGARGAAMPVPGVRGDIPQEVVGSPVFEELTVGVTRVCGIAEDGKAYCAWNPPLGDGVTGYSFVPVEVALQGN